MKKLFFTSLLWVSVFLPNLLQAGEGSILMASTIGPVDSGIVALLEERFEMETGIRVRHVGAGTGEALDIARHGSVELVMVHARSLEEKFVAEGFGTARIPFMYNDFVIVGPAADPAGIAGMKSAAAALQKIAAKEAPFVSRGDNSGTNVAELALWEKAGIKPAGPWYDRYEKGKEGNVVTLIYASEKGAYTFIDRATWLAQKARIRLPVLVEKDESLINYISLIPVNPKKFPRVNNAAAVLFVNWLTAPDKGQLVVRDFGKDIYGQPLFFPDSTAWHESRIAE